ncbi:hypothetical protein KF728_18680 [Candidatus Obscuribacterales bacterium]|nr:hypothetical protein [Candidatus Obscuribacterales bacterium]
MADRQNGDHRAQEAPSRISDQATNSDTTDNAGDLSRQMWAPQTTITSGDTGARESQLKSGGASTATVEAQDGFGIVGTASDSSEAQKTENSSKRSEIFDKGETSDNPAHPSNWKTDEFGNVTEAGPEFSAKYNEKGELESVRQGNDTWTRGADGNIQHSWVDSKGETHEDLIDNVRSFSAEPYFSDLGGGLLGGMTVEIGTGKTSSSSHSRPVYQDSAHDKAATGIVNGWIKGLKEQSEPKQPYQGS